MLEEVYSFRIDSAMLADITRLADLREISVSEFIREAINVAIFGSYEDKKDLSVPTDRGSLLRWYYYFYNCDCYVQQYIDWMTYDVLDLNKLDIDTVHVDFAEKALSDLNNLIPLSLMTNIAKEYFLYGDCFIITELECNQCKTIEYFNSTNNCEHNGAKWSKINIIDPNIIVKRNTYGMSHIVTISLRENDKFIEKYCDVDESSILFQAIQLDKENKHIQVSDFFGHHFARGSVNPGGYGTSILQSQLIDLSAKHQFYSKIKNFHLNSKFIEEEKAILRDQLIRWIKNKLLLPMIKFYGHNETNVLPMKLRYEYN